MPASSASPSAGSPPYPLLSTLYRSHVPQMSLHTPGTSVLPHWKFSATWTHFSSSVLSPTSSVPDSWSSTTPSVIQASEQEPNSTTRRAIDSHATNLPTPVRAYPPSDETTRLDGNGIRNSVWDTSSGTTTGGYPQLSPLASVAPPGSSSLPGPEATGFSILPSSSPDHNVSGVSSTNTSAIAGGVTGGFVFIALLAIGAFLLVRRRRTSRPPPSAEFMHLARGPSELGFATLDGKKSPTLHRLIPGPLTRRGSLEDEENIPPLSPTLCYRDPVLEKAQESAAMREKYVASEEGGYQ